MSLSCGASERERKKDALSRGNARWREREYAFVVSLRGKESSSSSWHSRHGSLSCPHVLVGVLRLVRIVSVSSGGLVEPWTWQQRNNADELLWLVLVWRLLSSGAPAVPRPLVQPLVSPLSIHTCSRRLCPSTAIFLWESLLSFLKLGGQWCQE